MTNTDKIMKSEKNGISQLGDVNIVIDWDHFHELTAGDQDLEISILSIFFENAPDYINELSNCTPIEWSAHCHKIKGAARAIGGWSFAYAAECAERATPPEKGSIEHKKTIDALCRELDIFREKVTEKLDVSF